MFSSFIENNLISQNQSGFQPGDSYINQLLSITDSTYQLFDDGWEIRAFFFDISKILIK